MRRVLYAMNQLRKLQLQDRNAPPSRIQECDDMFRVFDRGLSGIKATDTNETLMEVMTSADFTYAIQEFVSRATEPGYTRMVFNYAPLVQQRTLPNYMTVTRYQRQAGVEDLEYVGEKGAPRPGSVVDAAKREYDVQRWEKEFDFSHEALINDDLDYFSDVATQMGEAARRTEERYVSRFYTNATTIARLVALGALYSTTGRLTTARISTARMAFGQRVDARNVPIEADLTYIVHHRGLVDTVATIQNSLLVPELATNASNVVRGTFTAIKDPHMAGVAPNLPWYAFSTPGNAGIVPFIFGRRQGVPGPMIMRKKSDIEAISSMLGGGTAVDPIWGDFESGNIVLKVVSIFGTYRDDTEGNMYDYRGCYYSSGTAP